MGKNSGVNGKDLFIGAVIGGVIGATAALLLAPKSGRETRKDLYKGLETARDNLRDQSEQVSRKAVEVKDAATDRWIDIRESTVDTVKEVASTVEGAKEKAGRKLEKISERTAAKLKS
ncbi:YtxH domain-containing protein [Salinithrix halophila]|uniref:YtxH domain-containing protein n=1 Tax=Salinithrix halophila TaxID=1485204 RepID=A0ABV8JE37_9BACL